jgi:hypothetical protein
MFFEFTKHMSKKYKGPYIDCWGKHFNLINSIIKFIFILETKI